MLLVLEVYVMGSVYCCWAVGESEASSSFKVAYQVPPY